MESLFTWSSENEKGLEGPICITSKDAKKKMRNLCETALYGLRFFLLP